MTSSSGPASVIGQMTFRTQNPPYSPLTMSMDWRVPGTIARRNIIARGKAQGRSHFVRCHHFSNSSSVRSQTTTTKGAPYFRMAQIAAPNLRISPASLAKSSQKMLR